MSQIAWWVIRNLVADFPNDKELGARVRRYVERFNQFKREEKK